MSDRTDAPDGVPALLRQLQELEHGASPAPWFDNSYSRVHSAICRVTGIRAPKCYPGEHKATCSQAGVFDKLTGPELDRALGSRCAECGYHWDDECTPTVCEVPVIGGDTATKQGYKDMAFMTAFRNAAPALLARMAALENLRLLLERLHGELEFDGARVTLRPGAEDLLFELPSVLAALHTLGLPSEREVSDG